MNVARRSRTSSARWKTINSSAKQEWPGASKRPGPEFKPKQSGLLGPHPDVLQHIDRGRVRLVADGEFHHIDAGLDRTAASGPAAEPTTTTTAATAARDEGLIAAAAATAAATSAASTEISSGAGSLGNHLLRVDWSGGWFTGCGRLRTGRTGGSVSARCSLRAA